MNKTIEDYINSLDLDKEEELFHAKFHELLFGRNGEEMYVILMSHQLIEYYLDRYIEAAFCQIEKINDLRLNFASKIIIINNKRTPFKNIISALNDLNGIRNKFAHNIHYTLKESDLRIIKQSLKEVPNLTLKGNESKVEIIKHFTTYVCRLCDVLTTTIKRECPKEGLSGFFNLCDTLIRKEVNL